MNLFNIQFCTILFYSIQGKRGKHGFFGFDNGMENYFQVIFYSLRLKNIDQIKKIIQGKRGKHGFLPDNGMEEDYQVIF